METDFGFSFAFIFLPLDFFLSDLEFGIWNWELGIGNFEFQILFLGLTYGT